MKPVRESVSNVELCYTPLRVTLNWIVGLQLYLMKASSVQLGNVQPTEFTKWKSIVITFYFWALHYHYLLTIKESRFKTYLNISTYFPYILQEHTHNTSAVVFKKTHLGAINEQCGLGFKDKDILTKSLRYSSQHKYLVLTTISLCQPFLSPHIVAVLLKRRN